jgi:two-component system, LytTR family, response regulator
MYRAVVIDDEPRACRILEVLVGQYLPEITAFRQATSPAEGVTLIRSFRPHLVFLDVEMPLQNGFDVLNELDEIDFEVIFTTAHSQFALQAIKVSALDYLLKPIDLDELRMAFEKFMRRTEEPTYSQALFQNLTQNLAALQPGQQRLPISTTEGLHFLPIAEIIHCEADSNYTFLHLTGHRRFCASKTLALFVQQLSHHDFVRVHKSHLINRQHIERIDPAGIAYLSEAHHVPISRRLRRGLL